MSEWKVLRKVCARKNDERCGQFSILHGLNWFDLYKSHAIIWVLNTGNYMNWGSG